MTTVVDRPGGAPAPDEVVVVHALPGGPGGGGRPPGLPGLVEAVRSREPGPPLSRGGLIVVWIVATISAAAVFFVVSATWVSGFQHQRSNSLLYAQLRDGISQATVPTGGVVAPGTPLAVLSIPALGLDNQVIVEGSDSQQTSRAIGHRRDGVLPGQFGVSTLYGRANTYGGVFSRIGDLRAGQKIQVTTAQGSFTYEVERVRRAGDPSPSALAANSSRIILSSAAGSLFADTAVVSVDAKIVGTPVEGPGGQPATVAGAEKVLGTNENSLVLLVLWLQGFLLAAVLATWAAFRWGRWQTWMVAVPLLLGTLWQVVQQVLLLLPNLY